MHLQQAASDMTGPHQPLWQPGVFVLMSINNNSSLSKDQIRLVVELVPNRA